VEKKNGRIVAKRVIALIKRLLVTRRLPAGNARLGAESGGKRHRPKASVLTKNARRESFHAGGEPTEKAQSDGISSSRRRRKGAVGVSVELNTRDHEWDIWLLEDEKGLSHKGRL